MARKPACGPSVAASISPPARCPLEPVPGIVKLIIWAANTNAPITPISGTLSLLRSSFILLLE